MNTKFRRIIAFVLDVLLISLLVGTLSNIKFLNPYKDKYKETYDLYTEASKKHLEEELTGKEYENLVITYNYDLAKYNVYYNVTNIVVTLSYFVLFAIFNKGQTIGQKLLKVQIKSQKDEKLNILYLILRTALITGIITGLITMISLYFTTPKVYYNIAYYALQLEFIIEAIILFTVIFNKEGIGLHDKIAKTIVIDKRIK